MILEKDYKKESLHNLTLIFVRHSDTAFGNHGHLSLDGVTHAIQLEKRIEDILHHTYGNESKPACLRISCSDYTRTTDTMRELRDIGGKSIIEEWTATSRDEVMRYGPVHMLDAITRYAFCFEAKVVVVITNHGDTCAVLAETAYKLLTQTSIQLESSAYAYGYYIAHNTRTIGYVGWDGCRDNILDCA